MAKHILFARVPRNKMFTNRRLNEIVRERPINLFLVETDALIRFANDGFHPKYHRLRALVELVARWCLSRDSSIDELMGRIWKDYWEHDFKPWYCAELPWTERSLPAEDWNDPVELAGFVSCLRERLLRIFEVHGFIPVYAGAVVRFIPFQLDDKLAAGAIVYDNDDSVSEDWHAKCKEALGGDARFGVRIQMLPENNVSLQGASLMLPLRMAEWRLTDPSFPKYDVLRVIATGAFDGQGRLEEVGVAKKLDGLKSQFKDAILLGPDGRGDIPGEERRFKRLDCGLKVEELRSAIIKELESTDCVSVSYAYAMRRLPDMHAEVDRKNHSRWSDLADRLQRLKNSVAPERDAERYLQFMTMLVTALLHAGRSQEAQENIHCAYEFALDKGLTAFALRLQINAMVAAQDDGEFEVFKTLSSEVENALSSYSGDERDDLLMRFHGTSMQAHAWGAMLGEVGFDKDESLCHARKAVGFAYEIANRFPGSDEAESNVAQDLNYCHLWHALFAPGKNGESDALQSAFQQLDNLSSKSKTTNLYHLKRQKSLAMLNNWRDDGVVADVKERKNYLLPKADSEGWMVCANRRHLGALAAADGCVDEAIAYFDEGDAALPTEKCYSPVLASIRFSLLVQAACSLREKDLDLARVYIQKTGDLLERFGESALFKRIKAKNIHNNVVDGADPRQLPKFYY